MWYVKKKKWDWRAMWREGWGEGIRDCREGRKDYNTRLKFLAAMCIFVLGLSSVGAFMTASH